MNKKDTFLDKGKTLIKELKYTIIFTCLFILFSEYLYEQYNKLIVTPILSNANRNLIVDIIFYLIIIGVFYSIYEKLKNDYFVKLSHSIFCFIVLIIYCYYRLNYADSFLSFKTVSWLKYFDAVFLYFIIPIALKLLLFFKPKKNRPKTKNTLLPDEHINSIEQDKLGRKTKAIRIYNEIKETSFNKSVAFGIVGQWGSGKTSFLEFIKEQFNNNYDKNYIVIDFNPWLNISLNSIIQDYFNTIENELKKHSIDISKNIKKYGNTVLNLNKNKLTESILKGSNLLFEKNLTDEFNNLNELLKKLNKRVLVFIDDFDRLQANEIFEILKLIRNTGGFDTFTYIVAYDKKYLIKSLKAHKIPYPNKFSEKIFLKEIELLPATNNQINSFLIEELTSRFQEKEDEIKELLDTNKNRYLTRGSSSTLTTCLSNLRETIRFINSYTTDYNEIKNDVLLRDYFILKLLKFKYYEVYLLLFINRDDFLKKEDYSRTGNKNLKYLLIPKDKNKNNSFLDDFKDSNLQSYITENYGYSKEDLKSISILINGLFSTLDSLKNNLSISYEVNYYKYFRDELSSSNLSLEEFTETMSSDFENIKIKMNEWNKKGKLENARYYLNDSKVYELKDRDEYEKYIKAMFHIANFKSDSLGRRKIFGFDFDILWRNLNTESFRIIETYYNNNLNLLKEFLFSILNNAESPFEYESLFCSSLENKINFHSKLIDKETSRSYLVRYFENYSQSVNQRDNNFWNLFHTCYVTDWVPKGNSTYSKKEYYLEGAKKAFKIFMARHLDDCLLIFIEPQRGYGLNDSSTKIGIIKLAIEIFDSYDGFVDFLQSDELKNNLTEPSEFSDEFIDFTKKFIQAGKMIEYNFKYYGINKRLNEIAESRNYQ